MVRVAALVLCLIASPAAWAESPTLVVVVSVGGARLELDGAVVAERAGRETRLETNAGTHVLSVSKDGFTPTRQTVQVATQGETRVEVKLAFADGARRNIVRVAVHELSRQGDIAERTVAIVSEAVLAEVRKLDRTSVVGMKEISELLSFEGARQLAGCDEESCLEEIGGALGVDELVTGTVGTLGGSTVFTLRRVDVQAARVIESITRRFPAQTGEELLAAVGPSLEALFPEVPLKAGRTRGASIEAARRLNPPPLPRWAFFTTAGVGAAAFVVGGAFGLVAADAAGEYRELGERSLTTPVAGAQLNAVAARATANERMAFLSLGIAGTALLAAGVEAFFTDWHGYGDEETHALRIVPSTDGLTLVAGF